MFFSVLSIYSQDKGELKSVISSVSSRVNDLNHTINTQVNGVDSVVNINSFSLNVGLPYMGIIKTSTINNTNKNLNIYLGFPWNTLYKYNTFNENFFTVSKGYYSDKIQLNWVILDNKDDILRFTIYRTKDISSENPDWGDEVVYLSETARSYTDIDIEGATLYRYKIVADIKGIDSNTEQLEYINFITGIGYRNPTGVITGRVTFQGGSPVQDVTISAVPVGGTQLFGSSLKVANNSQLSISNFHEPIDGDFTLQMWLKPENPTALFADTLQVYSLNNKNFENIKFNLSMTEEADTSKRLNIEIGGNTISLSNYIPSGMVDIQGDDILIEIDQINTKFNHFTTVFVDGKKPELYINSRKISSDYINSMNSILKKYPTDLVVEYSETTPYKYQNTKSVQDSQKWTSLQIGGGITSYVDEIRLWEKELINSTIRTDFRRYLYGNETKLHTYIRANEGKGNYAYDLSRTGYDFHENHAVLNNTTFVDFIPVEWANEAQNIPTSDQLGVLGVTDSNGNFTISSVPYSGNGEAFTITPSFGKHEFSPNQALVFLGNNNSVINNVNFDDTSSFEFHGQVLYDTRGVFEPTDETIDGTIEDDVYYNAYKVGNLKYQKGEYWFDDNSGKLKRYAPVPVSNALVFIDGVQAMNSNNVPIKSDQYGAFVIQVPIGNHSISVSKANHEFTYNGRFPENIIDSINGEEFIIEKYFDFFEDKLENTTFIDNTKINVVGRIVGGRDQEAKTIGFGFNGLYKNEYVDDSGVTQTDTISSINNIGSARIKFTYIPSGSDVVSDRYQKTITTNSETGEYRTSLLPINYKIFKNDINFVSGKNPGGINILSDDKVLNYTNIKAPNNPRFNDINNNVITSDDLYNEVLSFTYIASPIFSVQSQTSRTELIIDNENYRLITDDPDVPLIYDQFETYEVQIRGRELYENYDSNPNQPTIDTVPVTDGKLNVTNNLALGGTEYINLDQIDDGLSIYSFKAGNPSNSQNLGYRKTIDLKYEKNNQDFEISGYNNTGVILGGVSDGSQTFVTAGPEKADIILRDPPGSSSSASIEKGSSFSFTESGSFGLGANYSFEQTASMGVIFEIGGGLAGPVVRNEGTLDVKYGYGVKTTSEYGTEATKTYTFNQTISTSDDPNWVGSNADLYIGYSSNQFYGTYDKLSLKTSAPINGVQTIRAIKQIDSIQVELNPVSSSALYFTEGEEKTFFIYSQYQILNEIIPAYQKFIEDIESGAITENTDGVMTKNYYESSIKLWRQVILFNERDKYLAFNKREDLKLSIEEIINKTDGTKADDFRKMLNDNFYENISFDGGVGEFSNSSEVLKLSSDSYSFTFDMDASFGDKWGFEFNGTGYEMNWNYGMESTAAADTENSEEQTLNFSYTLKDNDSYNFFSVDVVNAFDGHGPIFATIGGQTSCPYEPEEKSIFFTSLLNEDQLIQAYIDYTGYTYYTPEFTPYWERKLFNYYWQNEDLIPELEDDQKVSLTYATQNLEEPLLEVTQGTVLNVPDGKGAEFVLTLSNQSPIKQDALFRLFLDQTTNPHGAIINVPAGGLPFLIPAGESVQYTVIIKKAKEDQFDYNNIRFELISDCNGDIGTSSFRATGSVASGEVFLNASFVPTCTTVNLSVPSNNWVFNTQSGNNLPIKINGYNSSFDNLNTIKLQYRRLGAPNWVTLRTYFKDIVQYNNAQITSNLEEIELIGNQSQLNYNWVITYDDGVSSITDGFYEIRAISNCSGSINDFESEIIVGKVDLSSPSLFATPTPTNGKLSVNDDIKIIFNEDVRRNGLETKFELNIQQNLNSFDHQVSLSFNGSSNFGVISKPAISNGSLSIEFWLKYLSDGYSTIISQNEGIQVRYTGAKLQFEIGDQTFEAEIDISTMKSFNHFTLSYDDSERIVRIIMNDQILSQDNTTNKSPLVFTNSKDLIIGGNTFVGNMHDLRLWKRAITKEDSVSMMNELLNGKINGQIGCWPMNEGSGSMAMDMSRNKHIKINNASWEINPKGTSYYFDGKNYLDFDQTGMAIITPEMDATLSFWIKTKATEGTIISNGNGEKNNGKNTNLWAISILENKLVLRAEGNSYSFGEFVVNNDSWHQISLSLSRNGTIKMFVNGNLLASYPTNNIAGFNSGHLFIGARGQQQNDTTINIDNYYVGYIDELKLWNNSKSQIQIKNEMNYEVDSQEQNLILYSSFNAPEVSTTNGPTYYVPKVASQLKDSHYAKLNASTLISYGESTPGIKPFRSIIPLGLIPVFRNNEILLNTDVSDWSQFEGKLATIEVSGLYDFSDNRQSSPITWSFIIDKHPLKWSIVGKNPLENNELLFVKNQTEKLSFEIKIDNVGIESETYSIDFPEWITISEPNGSIGPLSSKYITASFDENISVGDYHNGLSLNSNFNFIKLIQIELRVLPTETELPFDPKQYNESMTIVGQINIDGVFENDVFDKVYAKVGNQIRGVGKLEYDRELDNYFVYLTVYSNLSSSSILTDPVQFYIWVATEGKLIKAKINGQDYISFNADSILGDPYNPVLFTNSNIVVQKIDLNKGWNWVSFNVSDSRFNDLNQLTQELILTESDVIKSQSKFDNYFDGWSGDHSNSGGLDYFTMYKFNISSDSSNILDSTNSGQILLLQGKEVDLSDWSINLNKNWTWLPYPVTKIVSIQNALANLDPQDGDLIKSQTQFAIYTEKNGWKGTLKYLYPGKGYMIKLTNSQTFSYPNYINSNLSSITNKGQAEEFTNFINPSEHLFNYSSNMNLVVKIPDAYEDVVIYDAKGKVRSLVERIDINGSTLYFMTVFGDIKESLNVYLINSFKEKSIVTNLDFIPESIVGTIKNPLLFEVIDESIVMYPNPFESKFELSIDSESASSVKVELCNIVGQTLYSKIYNVVVGKNIIEVTPDNNNYLLKGIYIIKISKEDNVYIKKIIKN